MLDGFKYRKQLMEGFWTAVALLGVVAAGGVIFGFVWLLINFTALVLAVFLIVVFFVAIGTAMHKDTQLEKLRRENKKLLEHSNEVQRMWDDTYDKLETARTELYSYKTRTNVSLCATCGERVVRVKGDLDAKSVKTK